MKKILFIFLLFHLVAYSFSAREQNFIDNSNVSVTMDSINEYKCKYVIGSCLMKYESGRMESVILVKDTIFHVSDTEVKYAKKTSKNEYVPYIIIGGTLFVFQDEIKDTKNFESFSLKDCGTLSDSNIKVIYASCTTEYYDDNLILVVNLVLDYEDNISHLTYMFDVNQ